MADGIGAKFGRLIFSLVAFFAGYILGFFFLWKMTFVMLAFLPIVAVSAGVIAKVIFYHHQVRDCLRVAGGWKKCISSLFTNFCKFFSMLIFLRIFFKSLCPT